jgi:hypothetical protein
MLAVRKRIVICFLIVSVIGTAVFLFSQPKPGTVEWHLQVYWRASDRLHKDDWRSRLGSWVSDKSDVMVGFLYPSRKEMKRLVDEIEFHDRALRRLGAVSGTDGVARP